MSLLIANLDKKKLQEEQNRIVRIAKGEGGAYIDSALITNKDIEELAAHLEKADKEAQQEPVSAIAKVIYAQAMLRDAVYATQGRKFMRTMSLNTKRSIIYNRAYIIEETKPKPTAE